MTYIDAILIVELALLLFAAGVWALAAITTKLHEKMYPHYPYCHADPRCHSEFAWDAAGNGWIGSHKVIDAHVPREHVI